MNRPVPTALENSFDFTELFFSTTDLRGVIQSGNDVFVRVSKYRREQLIGAPHSVIRHPDMPRAVFKLLWDTIQAGQPIMAYVKNMAADGSYYWVQAFVFPLEGAYLSIRIKPSSPLLAAAQELYPAALEVEKEGGMEASVPFLLEKLKEAGFPTYTDFMVKSALAELVVIQDHLQKNRENLEDRIQRIADISDHAAGDLKSCARHIGKFQEANQVFIEVMDKLNEAFMTLKYIALNMTVSSAKFGEKVASLGVVAKEFSRLSEEIQAHLTGLTQFMQDLQEVVTQCAVRIAGLEVQMLMVVFFVKESVTKMKTSDDAFADMLAQRPSFSSLFKEYALELGAAMKRLEERLQDVAQEMVDVRKLITGLEVICQVGAVESSRENEVRQTFTHYLEEMRRFISLLQMSTTRIHKEMAEMEHSRSQIVDHTEKLADQVETVFDLAAQV